MSGLLCKALTTLKLAAAGPNLHTLSLKQSLLPLTRFGVPALRNNHCGCFGSRVGGSSSFSTSSRQCISTKDKDSAASSPLPKEKDVQSAGPAEDMQKLEEPESGQVFKHERHNLYVCWHPEVPYPYEMTKTIDLSAPISDSHLKVQSILPTKEAFRRKNQKLIISELVKLTYSTKHRFYGQFGMKKRRYLRENQPNKERRNREYL